MKSTSSIIIGSTGTALNYAVVVAVTVATLLLASGMGVLSCSVFPSIPMGPYMSDIYPSQSSNVITTTDPNLLIGSVQLYANDTATPTGPPVDVTIDLATGLVTKGLPTAASATVPPTALEDTTGGGYFFAVNGSQAFLASPDGSITVEVNLTAPENFSIVPGEPGYNYIFFVSDKTGYGYILYETKADCAAGSLYEQCSSCPTCTYPKGRAALVNLKDQTYNIIDFDYFDFDVWPLPSGNASYNTLSTVYDEIQIAQLGPEDSCGGKSYFFYSETNVTQASFIEGDLKSLVYGDTPAENTAYELLQNEEFTDGSPNATGDGVYGTRTVKSFSVVHKSIVTGDILKTIPLDYNSIAAVVGYAANNSLEGTPMPQTMNTGTPTTTTVTTATTSAPVVTPAGNATTTTTSPVSTTAPVTTATTAPSVGESPNVSPVGPSAGGGASVTSSPTGRSSSVASDAPSDIPSKIPAVPVGDPRDCQVTPTCAALGLVGQCCPTADNWTLACCDNITVEQTCALNGKCKSLDLVGACCPTPNGKYLDCCDAVPDKCQVAGRCQFYSALLYKKDLAAAAAANSSTREQALVFAKWAFVAMLLGLF